jgi:hypothetical protein
LLIDHGFGIVFDSGVDCEEAGQLSVIASSVAVRHGRVFFESETAGCGGKTENNGNRQKARRRLSTSTEGGQDLVTWYVALRVC